MGFWVHCVVVVEAFSVREVLEGERAGEVELGDGAVFGGPFGRDDEGWEEEGPGEKGEEGPEVEHLGEVDGCYVVGFVAEYDSAVPDDECDEDGGEG